LTRIKRAVAALAVVVDGARHQFLAGAGLAGDQNGSVGRRHQIDLPQRCWIAALLPMMPW